jgi:WD40 repeat protein
MSLSADGRQLVFIAGQGKIALWNEDDPDDFREIKLEPGISAQCMAFSPDGHRLVVGLGADVRVYHTSTLKEMHSWPGHRQAVGAVVWSADGQMLRTTDYDGNTFGDSITWSADAFKPVKTQSRSEMNKGGANLISPDRTAFIKSYAAEEVSVYQVGTGVQLARLSLPPIQSVRSLGFFTLDSKFFVLPATDRSAKAIDLVYAMPSCKLLCQLPAASANEVEIFRSGVFDIAAGPVAPPLVLSANGSVAASFSREDGRINVYDTAAEKIKHRLGSPAPQDVIMQLGEIQGGRLEISPDGKWLASWSVRDRAIRVWDLTKGTLRRTVADDLDSISTVRFAWSADGRMFAIAKKNAVQLWETSSVSLRKEFTGHAADIYALSFSPDGRHLATASADSTVLIWDVRRP